LFEFQIFNELLLIENTGENVTIFVVKPSSNEIFTDVKKTACKA